MNDSDNHARSAHGLVQWHGTTIIGVKKNGKTIIAGDGQVSMGNTVMKPNARKVRRIGAKDEHGLEQVIAGFAGATADAFTLFERLEKKLEQYRGQLMRAAVELAKDWRTDKYLRNLEALMIVADKDSLLVLTGNGDVLEPGEIGGESAVKWAARRSPRSVRAATTRWPPGGRFANMKTMRNGLRARRCRLRPISVCLPTGM